MTTRSWRGSRRHGSGVTMTLPLRVAVVDPAERLDDLAQREAPIDDRLELAGRDQLLQGRHVVRVERLPPEHRPVHLSLASEISGPTTCPPRIGSVEPAERDVDAVRPKRAPDLEDRVVGVGVEDPVVALAGLRVVDLRVVDDVVGAERADEVQLVGAGDAGHLGAHRLRDLDGERADVARRADDQDLVARLDRSAVATAEALEREDRRVREGCRFLERHAGRHRCERLLRRADVLGEGAPALQGTGRRRPRRPA